jgi:hypothetical protein
MGGAYGTYGDGRSAYRVFVGKPERKTIQKTYAYMGE